MTNIQKLLHQLDSRSTRERACLLVVTLVVLVFAANQLVFQPATRAYKAAQSQFEQLLADNRSLQSAMSQAEIDAQTDPDAQTRKQIAQLKTSIAAFDQQLQDRLIQLLSPQEMPVLLQQVLQQQAGLRLLKLENLPPLPLFAGSEDKAPQPQLFRHALKFEIEGNYLSLLKYLKALEALPRKFYWDFLHIEQKDQALPLIHVQLHTLSLTEDWIGV